MPPADPRLRDHAVTAVEERRKALNLTWDEVAIMGGISPRALQNFRNQGTDPSRRTMEGIDKGLQWAPGSLRRLLDGGDPVPLGPAVPAAPEGGWLPALEVEDEAEIGPYMERVAAEVVDAVTRHGAGVTGSQIFASDHEAGAWDALAMLPARDRLRTVAKIRMALGRLQAKPASDTEQARGALA